MWLAYVELGIFAAAVASAFFYQHWFLTKTRQWFRVASMLVLVALCIHAIYQVANRDELQEPVWADNARTWSNAPLDVWWNYRAFSDYNEAIETSIRMWNREVGCEVLHPVPAAGLDVGAQVLILSGSRAPCGHDEATQVLGKDDNMGTWLCASTAEIYVQKVDWEWSAYKAFAHEFGHVLGLAHDPSGLMAYPTTTDLVLPNRKDAKALRARYCH